MILWLTGQKNSGKTTYAKKLVGKDSNKAIHLDEDDLKKLWPDLILQTNRSSAFDEGIKIAELAKLLEGQGFDVIVSAIAPYEKLRKKIRQICKCTFFYITHNDFPNDPAYPYEVCWDAEVFIDRKSDRREWEKME